MPNALKPLPIKPLTGPLDFRTPPDVLANINGAMRFRQNLCSGNEGALERGRGFNRFLGGNSDLHDQLLPLQTYYDNKSPRRAGDDAVTTFPNGSFCDGTVKTRSNGREMINFGQCFHTEVGTRTIVGTRSRLYLLNETTKNYRILADGFGGTGSYSPRFYGAYLNGNIIFTNGVNQPVAWPLGGKPTGCQMQSVRPIQDLDDIALSKAGFVCEFNGCIFLFDITLNGVRFANSFIWSDFKDGTSYDPANADTQSGQSEVAPGHTILWAAELFGALMVYTDRGIFKVTPTGSSPAFTVTEVYSDEDGAGCLAFKNTALSLGTYHLYLGIDGIYAYDPYKLEPERVEWMHPASGVIFEGTTGYGPINKDACEATVAGFRVGVGGENEEEVYISWAEVGYSYPTKTLVLNTKLRFAYTVDHGFSAMFSFVPNPRVSVRDFLLRSCVCSASELQLLGLGFVKEGQPTEGCSGSLLRSIYTQTTATRNGYVTEDWDVAEADSDSLCAALQGATLDDLCRSCETTHRFIGASTTDWCLKAIGEGYVRVICTNPDTATGPGTNYQNIAGAYSSFVASYSVTGYYSIVRGAPQSFGSRSHKTLQKFIVELAAAAQVHPCVLQLRIGVSHHAQDPNGPNVIWYPPVRKYLEETDTMTPEQYAAQNIIPNLGMEYPLYRTGIWFYWELTIGSLTTPADISSTLIPAVGGSCTLSSVWQHVRQTSNVIK